ncbi:MAG: Fe-S cluster assembly protein SufB [Candidatus Woesearchaeota archaeon]
MKLRKMASKIGITKENIIELSKERQEPKWLLDFRLKGLEFFFKLDMPSWSPVEKIDYEDILIDVKALNKKINDLEELPKEIKETYKKLGIPEAEINYLSGSATQLEAEVIYKKLKEEIKKRGIIFESMEEAVKNHENLVKEYFGKLIGFSDNKAAALNAAAWTGGTFIYVPKGIKLEMPLQTFYLINFERTGQFERTLIIVDEDAELHYIEGCTAPIYKKANVHAGVVEIFVKKNAKMRFTTIQNWSKNVYNFSTKRALVEENGIIEWIDGNLGSKLTMKYPMAILKDNAKAEILSLSLATENQIIDAGAKVLFQGKNCRANVINKSIVKDNAIANFRSLAKTSENSSGMINIDCDSLILSEKAESNTFPTNINNGDVLLKHEAKASYIDETLLYYLKSKGIPESKAKTLLVLGFLSPVAKELPLEYAIELNKLIELSMEK